MSAGPPYITNPPSGCYVPGHLAGMRASSDPYPPDAYLSIKVKEDGTAEWIKIPAPLPHPRIPTLPHQPQGLENVASPTFRNPTAQQVWALKVYLLSYQLAALNALVNDMESGVGALKHDEWSARMATLQKEVNQSYADARGLCDYVAQSIDDEGANPPGGKVEAGGEDGVDDGAGDAGIGGEPDK